MFALILKQRDAYHWIIWQFSDLFCQQLRYIESNHLLSLVGLPIWSTSEVLVMKRDHQNWQEMDSKWTKSMSTADTSSRHPCSTIYIHFGFLDVQGFFGKWTYHSMEHSSQQNTTQPILFLYQLNSSPIRFQSHFSNLFCASLWLSALWIFPCLTVYF